MNTPGMRPLKRNKRLIISSCSICFIMLIILYVRKSLYMANIRYYSHRNQFDKPKYVHLDLKGAPPKPAYLQKILPTFTELGATGLLIEYEDMFPYSGNLRAIPAYNYYTEKNIQSILNSAKDANLLVIPLVQTFGHLEYVLKLNEFKELREVSEYPQTICPTNSKSLEVIKEMITQVVEKHPNITFIHIGGDEVEHVGLCDKCRNFLKDKGWSKQQLFLHHTINVAAFIKQKYPQLRILMWDDKLRNIPGKILRNSPITSLIEPVVWNYEKNAGLKLNRIFWQNYKVFPRIWGASAFKGASGSNQYFVSPNFYLDNQRSWMTVMESYQKVNFQGIFLTGWQRYDHFSILCELLPVAIPSLALCLKVLNGRELSAFAAPVDVVSTLNCDQPLGLMDIRFGSPKCVYPGGDLYEVMFRFHHLKRHFNEIIQQSSVKGWMNDYNIRYEFSSPHIVQSATSTLPTIKALLEQIKVDTILALQEVYDNYTITEWCETYVDPLIKDVSYWVEVREMLLSKTTWPKRPFQKSIDEFYPNVI